MKYKTSVKYFLLLLLVGIGFCLNPKEALAEETTVGTPMYRLYNPNSSEHFYTASVTEKNWLAMVGWTYEGIGWYAPTTGAPVYRLYNGNAGDHHYTLDANERDSLVSVGWKDEGIGWYSSVTQEVPLYRVYCSWQTTGTHHYTTSLGEKNNLLTLGWQDEGIAWYGLAEGVAADPSENSPGTFKQLLDVPMISQLPELPTGCEITAITMMLQYKGINVSKEQLAKEMPRHASDPNKGYVGDPFTPSGWTVYPAALTGIIEKYAGSVNNLSGQDFTAILTSLVQNKPVVAWVTMHGFSVHAVTVTGYSSDTVFYNDPWTGEKNASMSRDEFIRDWQKQDRRAISY